MSKAHENLRRDLSEVVQALSGISSILARGLAYDVDGAVSMACRAREAAEHLPAAATELAAAIKVWEREQDSDEEEGL